MAKFLSQEWHDAARALAAEFPQRPGASARMAFVVTGAPGGELRYHQIVEDGRVLQQANGELADADFTLTSTWDDSVRIQRGELDANTAFMQGKLKCVGSMGKLMQMLPLTTSPEYRELQAKLRDVTDY